MRSRPGLRRARGIAVLAVVLSATVLFLGASSAPAATTIGSNLASAGTGACNDSPCTMRQRSLPGFDVTAPADGVLVRWRVKTGDDQIAQPVRLRVIDGIGALSTGVRSSEIAYLPPGVNVSTFATRLPIGAGQYLGLDTGLQNYLYAIVLATSSAELDTWMAPLADGETRAPTGSTTRELLVNADLEPDADHDGFGDETQDACPSDGATQFSCPSSGGSSPPPAGSAPTSPSSPGSPAPGPGLLAGACANNPATGTAAGDSLTGTNAGDRLAGLAGDDVIRGLAGDDCLTGGTGDDRITAGSGDDEIAGNRGNDSLRGAGGDDDLSGGRGRDLLVGGTGTNTYSGGAGNDRVSASNDRRETIRCGTGSNDRATVDADDRVRRCEHVTRRR